LREPAEPLDRLWSRARRLNRHLGPMLYQLPPRWRPNLERLEEFLASVPRGDAQALEIRDRRWYRADVLAALGVNVSADPSVSEACLNEVGICFMFAPLYHGATARVAGVRRELSVHTTFNLLGPLTNPAGAPRQVIGVWHEALVEPLAHTLKVLGSERAWVVHGLDGLDEVTLDGRTKVAEVSDEGVRVFEVAPEEFGLESAALDGLRGGDAEANAAIIRSILAGERRDAGRALVCANAAAALYVGGAAGDLKEAARLAAESIDGGAALAKLEGLVRASKG
jgi:anthranilate phosphoribosyltransferase